MNRLIGLPREQMKQLEGEGKVRVKDRTYYQLAFFMLVRVSNYYNASIGSKTCLGKYIVSKVI